MKKKTYKVAVSYSIAGFVYIKAENLEEAKDMAYGCDTNQVKEKGYIDGSWEINHEMTDWFNNE